MDKRSILFVILLALAMFGINIYFEQGRQESLKEWNEQRKAKLQQQQAELESQIKQETDSLNNLPLVNLYADPSGSQFLSQGFAVNDSIISLSWQPQLPQSIYAKKDGSSASLAQYKLSFLPQNPDEPVVYQVSEEQLTVGDLPEFGTFKIYLVAPATTPEQKSQFFIGNYEDGQFQILNEKLDHLKDPEKRGRLIQKSLLAFLEKEGKFIPVAIYDGKANRLILLNKILGMQKLIDQSSTAFVPTESAEQKYFVLETPYQQLVFTNVGGALAEINLPFKSEKNPDSVVKEIEFDRNMVEHHAYNSHFPSHPYFTPDQPDVHSKGVLGGYYPLLRRDLIQSNNQKSVKIPARFYALNVLSDYPEVAELVYEVKKFDKYQIVFEATQSHRRITKTYTLPPEDTKAPYIVDLAIKIEGDTRGLWLGSGIPEVEWISGAPAPALKYRITRNNKPSVENIDLPQTTATVTSVYPDWICNSNGFLGTILDPIEKNDPGFRVEYVAGTTVPSRLVEVSSEFERFKPQDMPGYLAMLPIKASNQEQKFRIFAGPFSEAILKQVDQTFSDPKTGYNADYLSCQTFHGWFAFISEPFAKFLFVLMKFFHGLTGSWAFSIILLTVALRIMMYPLNAWSTKSMVKMQQIAPQVTAIQEKYKKDPKTAQIEVMNLYREKGVNPVSGCLPLLIQMPFLIGMFDLLKSTFELRGASFIPGWIDDLSAPDVLFSWKTPIFFIGNEFHLLPILLGLVMFIQQRYMSSAPSDPSQMTDQQRQQRAMGTVMSVVFALMFYHFPSGLNIYWLSSMLLGILQQWWTTKRMQAAGGKVIPIPKK